MASNSQRGALLTRVSIALGTTATLAVLLRLLARWRTKARFGADDCLVIISLIPSYGMIVESYLCTEFPALYCAFKTNCCSVQDWTHWYADTFVESLTSLRALEGPQTSKILLNLGVAKATTDFDVHNYYIFFDHHNGQNFDFDALPPNFRYSVVPEADPNRGHPMHCMVLLSHNY